MMAPSSSRMVSASAPLELEVTNCDFKYLRSSGIGFVGGLVLEMGVSRPDCSIHHGVFFEFRRWSPIVTTSPFKVTDCDLDRRISSSSTLLRINRHFRRGADGDLIRRRTFPGDAHRDALDNLHEIAGGVVRRQQ